MEENFNPVARTRANYYTPGSPVQFVCVELLKGDVSGEHAVCLTFKNISKVTLTALEIHFKCKGVDGVILCEDRFEYRDLEVKRLSVELEKALETRMNRPELKYQPQVFENGWYCACGAFHPKEEDTVYCSECGCDRILLQNALNTLLQPEQPAQTEPELETPLTPQAEEPTRIMGAAPVQEEPTRIMGAPCREAEPQPEEPAVEQTRVLDAVTRAQFPGRASHAAADEGTRVMPAAARRAQPISQQQEPAYDDEEEYEDERDSVAEALIRWVPPITAIVCAAVALCGFVYYQFVL